jgi:AraC family transcriptional regulator, positive regulator of tynA and feaB
MQSWSTDTINERERFSYWRDVVCQSLFNVSAEAPTGHFTGTMNVRASGPLRFLTSESSCYRFTRTRRNISAAPADHCTILMQLHGETAIEQNDNAFRVRPNDIAIFDGRQPFNALNSEGGRRVVAVVPRAMINSRAPWLSRQPLYRFPNSRFLDLARRHMVHLVSEDLTDNQTGLLTENLRNLLALASTDVAPNRLQAELQLEALLAFCRENLRSPKLSPQFAAEQFRISVRTVHLRFAALGQTFGRWVLEARLEACGKALRDPAMQARNVSEIAYSYGFNDLSHFNKTFRARFGMTPREFRFESFIESVVDSGIKQ